MMTMIMTIMVMALMIMVAKMFTMMMMRMTMLLPADDWLDRVSRHSWSPRSPKQESNLDQMVMRTIIIRVMMVVVMMVRWMRRDREVV